MFFLLAAGLVAVVLTSMLHGVWRGALRQPSAGGARRRAWQTTAMLLGLLAAPTSFYALRGDPDALSSGPGVLSEQFAEQGAPEGQASEQFYAVLERHLIKQPRDYRALVLKARLDMRAERFDRAVAGYEKAVAGLSRAAKDPAVWVEYAEARGMAQGRTLVGEPLRLVQRALALDAHHAQALELAGSAAWEMRDYANAAKYWERLLTQLTPGETRHAELTGAIERAQRLARLSLPHPP